MPFAEPAQPIQRRSLHDELVDRLRELITGGELKPGAKIPERELCDRFGVSRTPMREALKVLAADGLVRLTPSRGAAVSTLTLAELEDAFPVMGALEALAGEIACARITEAEIAEVRALHETMVGHWQAGRRRDYFRCNQQIHEAILAATRNAALQSVYRSLSLRLINVRYVANMSPATWQRAIAEHEEILAALATRDGPRLASCLRVHLAHKCDTVRRWLLRDQAGE